MRILLWHVHGSWTTSFVHGAHDYVIPVLPDRGPDGRGRACTWTWPETVVERCPEPHMADDVDLVVLQRPHEAALLQRWTGLVAGRDIPAVYVEHDCPRESPIVQRHVLAGQDRIPLVHVTHHNNLMWDSGRAHTTVIEHGVVDPAVRWSGEVARVGVVVNEPVRRGRLVGLDVLMSAARRVPVDAFGIGVSDLPAEARAVGVRERDLEVREDLPQHRMHQELAQRRAYLHTMRWTSLGFSLIEAMLMEIPVAALATTEAPRALAAGGGVVSCDLDELICALTRWLHDPDEAESVGRAGRVAALQRYGLARFLHEWDVLAKECVR